LQCEQSKECITVIPEVWSKIRRSPQLHIQRPSSLSGKTSIVSRSQNKHLHTRTTAL